MSEQIGQKPMNLVKGILWLVFSAFCFAVMAALAHAAGDLPFTQKAFFRNFIALVCMVSVIWRGRKSLNIPDRAFKYLILRAVCGSLGIFGNFYALDRIPIADSSILNKMSPFFAILFSLIVVGEKIRLVPFLATMGAFVGSVFIIKPSANILSSLPALAGFLGGMGAGFAYACVRKLGQMRTSGTVIILFFSAFSCALCLPFMIIDFTPMTVRQVIILLGCGLFGLGGQFGITYAYYNAPARDISIFDYSQIIFAASLGWIMFRQVPDIYSWIGYSIIIFMAVIVFVYNRKQFAEKKERE